MERNPFDPELNLQRIKEFQEMNRKVGDIEHWLSQYGYSVVHVGNYENIEYVICILHRGVTGLFTHYHYNAFLIMPEGLFVGEDLEYTDVLDCEQGITWDRQYKEGRIVGFNCDHWDDYDQDPTHDTISNKDFAFVKEEIEKIAKQVSELSKND